MAGAAPWQLSLSLPSPLPAPPTHSPPLPLPLSAVGPPLRRAQRGCLPVRMEVFISLLEVFISLLEVVPGLVLTVWIK
jgi:hypothetical protein